MNLLDHVKESIQSMYSTNL